MTHTIDLDEMLAWIADSQTAWVTYASSSEQPKGLEVAAGRCAYRVMHGSTVVYEGTDGRSAVNAYNSVR